MDKRGLLRFILSVIRALPILLILTLPALAQRQHIAPTEAQDPETQRQQFHLPPGFEIQLVLAEPDIGQPMNLSFDVQGRLWVTSSVEYPFPAQTKSLDPRIDRLPEVGDDSPSDWLTIASGIGPDGKPAKVERFIEGLNIPIGQTPMGDGSSGIVYNIADISLYRDEDGDGRAEKRELLYSHFGNIDTHGMASSFRRWIDGWIYACHGFRNTSEIVDSQGRATELFSGHTYRFQPDGSQFEIYTRGQVNPFGLAIDPLGNVFSADCHSRPLYQLLPGAAYYRPSWGIPIDEPLGLGPEMIDHDHGSTSISGPAYYAADHFPEDYRDNLFLCNSVTRRVHRDKLVQYGSTLIADTQPDFITCDDPWFRPVDVTVGPDGALYIADFYNAIIGHYEVPLDHPKRDRTHGRVWRVVYKGPPDLAPDLTQLGTEQLIQTLDTKNESLRVLANHRLVDAFQSQDEALIREQFSEVSPNAQAHLLWVLQQCNELEDTDLESALMDESHVVRVHAFKILAERPSWRAQERSWALQGLEDSDGFVRRAAADGMRRHPNEAFLEPLFDAWDKTPEEDTHLTHVLRMAIREQLYAVDGWSGLSLHVEELTEIAAATRTAEAAKYVLLDTDVKSTPFETSLKTNANLLLDAELAQVVERIVKARLTIDQSIEILGALILNLDTDPSEELISFSLRQIKRALGRSKNLEPDVLELALELAGFLKLKELTKPLLAMALDGDVAACKAILEIDPEQGITVVLNNLSIAPADRQTTLAQLLSGSKDGAEQLLDAMEDGRASPMLLRDSVIRQGIGEENPRLVSLLEGLPDPEMETASLISDYSEGYQLVDGDYKNGKAAYDMHCVVCHSIGNEGGVLGPDLAGIEARGVERLLEDILDPNRNVDPAFMLTTLRTSNGQSISGMGARLEGDHYLLTDASGASHRTPQDEVVEKTDSRFSLMPATFGVMIKENQMYDMLTYLLSDRKGQKTFAKKRAIKRGSSRRPR